MNFTVNQEPCKLEGIQHSITYERVCELAKINPDHNPSVVYSVMRRDDSQRQGILSKGSILRLEEGMRIECCITGNA